MHLIGVDVVALSTLAELGWYESCDASALYVLADCVEAVI